MELEERVRTIEERNARVEKDKAWESSFTRRLTIAGLTYSVATGFLFVISDSNPPVHALVPTGGYLLSTLSLRLARNIFERR